MRIDKNFVAWVLIAVGCSVALQTRAEDPKVQLFDVVLLKFEDSKIQAIKAVREMSALGLKDAKDLVESAPKTVREGVTKEEGDAAVKALEAVKCKAELQPSKVTTLERYEAVLKSFDAAKKDQTLFTIKNNTGLSEEAVTKLLAAPPGTIKKGLTKAEADRIKATLTGINAEVEVKESGK